MKKRTYILCLTAVASAASFGARADIVTDWNATAGQLIHDARLGTPPATRAMALVQTAVHDAVSAAGARPANEASVDAAVAAANRVTLAKLLPAQEAVITAAYEAALARLADGPARTAGVTLGEKAANDVLARRLQDGAATPERYRPHAAPGAYVPTSGVAAWSWTQRKPWTLTSPAQFRPAPPPALNSVAWARDFEEVRVYGAKASTKRSPEQAEIARFWDYSLPPIYHGVLRSVATQPGRTVLQNARLFATASQAMDDGLIAVMDAKYHYNFWRPITAIRNGDRDGHDGTTLEAGWVPMIDTPLHPEYPSAHSVLAGAMATLLQADGGVRGVPYISTTSPTAGGATHRWKNLDDFTREVAESRVWGGIHYRTSIDVGLAMGRKIGAQAAAQFALAPASEAKLVERVAARGVQIYECRADTGTPQGAQWVFVAPQADLYDPQGKPQGTHYAGPHWEAGDGSKVVGKVEAKAEAPEGNAIPWLLLSARSVGGTGRYAGITSVQRVNTRGGLPPHQPCDARRIGRVGKVPYTADYLLYAS